jgi:hypothetical protein
MFISSQMAFSIDIYNEHTSNTSAMWANGYSTIYINNTRVKQYPIDSNNCSKGYCAYKGILSDDNLNLGDNYIEFKVIQRGCVGITKNISDNFNHYAINKDNKRIDFFRNLIREGKCPAKFNQSTQVNISLSQLDYQLYLSVNNAIEAQFKNLNDFKSNFQNIESQLVAESAKLDVLEKTINECFQTASNASDLSSLENQFSKCENFKKSYDELNSLIKSKELITEESRTNFNDGLKNFGSTISDFKHQGKSVIAQDKVDEIENSILTQMPALKEQKDNRINFIVKFSSNISDRLEDLYSQGKREEFIALAEYSENKLNEFSTELVAKNYPFAETQALTSATNLINKTLAKYIDKNFWFNDANIPQDAKDAIDKALSKVDKKAGLELKAALQMSSKARGEAVRTGIMKAISFFNVLDSIKEESTTKSIDSFMSRTANQLVTFIKNDGVCLGARLALNDAADLFELVSGRDFCNIKRELSWQERAFSGLGLVIGSGEMWSKVASKTSGTLSESSTAISNFFKKSAKAGLKTEEEIIEYGKVIASSEDKQLMKKVLDESLNEVKEITHYGPLEAGPLHFIATDGKAFETFEEFKNYGKGSIADTFRSSSYFKVALEEDLVLYRVQTKGSERLGAFWSRIKPGTGLSSKIDSALLSEYKNAANEIVSITIPKGTTTLEVFEGIVGEQVSRSEKLLGGGNQVYIKVDKLDKLKDFIIK